MSAALVTSLYFMLQVLAVLVVEESAKAGFKKLKKSKAVKRRMLVLWFCIIIHFRNWRSRKHK